MFDDMTVPREKIRTINISLNGQAEIYLFGGVVNRQLDMYLTLHLVTGDFDPPYIEFERKPELAHLPDNWQMTITDPFADAKWELIKGIGNGLWANLDYLEVQLEGRQITFRVVIKGDEFVRSYPDIATCHLEPFFSFELPVGHLS